MIQQEVLLGSKCIVDIVGEIRGEYSISTDSRNISSRDAFVALDGENFRGIHFIENCLKSDVGLVVVKKDKESEAAINKMISCGYSFSVIYVTDTTLYIQETARNHLKTWKKEVGGLVIGITGSNGKTTGKEMLRHVLEVLAPERVWCTHKNFNNHIGVPLTVMGLESHHKIVIVEMGTNHPGELRTLCGVCPPDAGYITNIGESHLEFFHDKGGVFEEKRTLYDAIKNNNGFFVVNQDDGHLKNLENYERSVSYGRTGKDAKFTLLKNGFELDFKGETIKFGNELINGGFNHFNMGMCVSLIMSLFPDKKGKAVEAVASFVPSDSNRSNWIELEGKEFFLDAYNANPSSMMVSLEFFIERTGGGGDSLFVLGDMNELGAGAGEFHRRLGAFLMEKGAKNAVFVGRHAPDYDKGFGGGAKRYDSLSSLEKDWSDILGKYEKFFIKGSRSLRLESLVDGKK